MDFEKFAQQSRKLAYEGKDYEEILKTIPISSLPEKKQKELLSLIDDFIVQFKLEEQVKGKYLIKLMLGFVLFFIGIFIIVFTYLRKESQYTIGLFASLIGLYVIKNAYKQYKQPIDYQPIAPVKDSIFRKY